MRLHRPVRFSLLLGTVAAVGLYLSAPLLAPHDDAKALHHLPQGSQELVTASCQHIKGGFGAYHPCVATFAASDEMAFFSAMSSDDRGHVYTACQKYWVFDTDAYINCFVSTVHSWPDYASKNPPYVAPKSYSARLGAFYASAWDSFTDFLGGNLAIVLTAVVLAVAGFVLMMLRADRRRFSAVVPYVPPVYQEPHPYRSSAAMDDFRETNAFGDAAFASAAEARQALSGAASHGPQPKFEE